MLWERNFKKRDIELTKVIIPKHNTAGISVNKVTLTSEITPISNGEIFGSEWGSLITILIVVAHSLRDTVHNKAVNSSEIDRIIKLRLIHLWLRYFII
nr:hypothetical protein BCU57_02945 [Shewanella sp. 10N.286.48.B5]